MPQVRLLAAAARQARAEQTLTMMQANYSAIAACMSSEGGRHFAALQRQLLSAARGELMAPADTAEQRRANRRRMAAALK